MLDTFHFLRPWWFLALIPAVILLFFILKSSASKGNLSELCDPHLLKHLVSEEQGKVSWLLPVSLFFLWLVAIIAIAGPTWSHYPQQVYQTSTARVIALDVSQSMNANDIAPTRMQRAQYKVLDLLKEIKEGQTGMIVFSSKPFVVSPLTSDAHTIANMVPVLTPDVVPVGGDNISEALKESAKLLTQAGFNRGVTILVTDSAPSNAAYAEAKRLESQGILTSILAIGTSQGGPIAKEGGGFMTNKKGDIVFANLDVDALKQLAKDGGGNYIPFTNNNSDVKTLLEAKTSKEVHQLSQQNKTKVLWKDEGHWLVWLLIALSALLIRKGWWERICR